MWEFYRRVLKLLYPDIVLIGDRVTVNSGKKDGKDFLVVDISVIKGVKSARIEFSKGYMEWVNYNLVSLVKEK